MTINSEVKVAGIIVGIVLSVVGITINNWKIAVIGNSIAVAVELFN